MANHKTKLKTDNPLVKLGGYKVSQEAYDILKQQPHKGLFIDEAIKEKNLKTITWQTQKAQA